MFLASLTAISLVTITSRHQGHQSLNSITFHNSGTLERRIPASSLEEIKYEAHGTRVTVRNLFGNLPVRIKQRTLLADQRGENNRLWDLLKRDVVALLLGWQRPMTLVIRDASRRIIISLNSRAPCLRREAALSNSKARPPELQYLLTMFTQAAWINVGDWASWVPASASTSNISIKGAISLEPTPTRRLQFMSLGICPIPNNDGNSPLYEEINRLFGLSAFGTIEEHANVDENEKLRRHTDKRYKTDGYTNRQLIGRKGVDRYPMFYLRICLKDDAASRAYDQHFLDKDANILAVIAVLQALITQWLSMHHFRPRAQRPRVRKRLTSSAREMSSPDALSRPSSTQSATLKRTAARSEHPQPFSSAKRQLSLNDWSRIKSGKAGFFDRIGVPFQRPESAPEQLDVVLNVGSTTGHAKFDANETSSGGLYNPSGQVRPQDQASTVEEACGRPRQGDDDETITWKDPRTKTAISLNARTGCVVSRPATPRHQSGPLLAASSSDTARSSQRLRLRERAQLVLEGSNTWLEGFLRSWNNPIFTPAEHPIRQICIEESKHSADAPCQSHQFHGTQVIRMGLRDGSMVLSNCKLSREMLQCGKVIAQLDKKFVLVKMTSNPVGASHQVENIDLLVLIDQHAADERIKVESLLADLCRVVPEVRNQYSSSLGHRSKVASTRLEKPMHFTITAQESQLFTTYAVKFAAWGILFDILLDVDPVGNRNLDRALPTISVTALPPAVSERCGSDPKTLISFLRSAVWKYAEQPHNKGLEELLAKPASEGLAESPTWVRRLASSPHGLVDLVNSRACRSAIMFNDELSREHCQELVRNLSKCVFPFMCAHGRPSMVPLVSLAAQEDASEAAGIWPPPTSEECGTGFISAWKRWRAINTSAP